MRWKVVSNHKMLCSSIKETIFCRGNILYICDKGMNGNLKYRISLPAEKYRVFAGFRLAQRALRLEPRCGVFVNENTAIISYHGGVYRVNTMNGNVYLEHSFRPGMNNPLSFCPIYDESLNWTKLLYGEYFPNCNKEQVSIYQRDKNGKWEIVFTFPPGRINHIHGIYPCEGQNRIIVVTGDSDWESAIWEFSSDFKRFRILAGGSQRYRSCVAFPYKSGVIYATDTPLEENAIYYIEPGVYHSHMDDDNGCVEPSVRKKLFAMPGPCIFGCRVSNGNYVFATSVEPDSRIKGKRYMVTYKLGRGIRDRCSYIIMGNPEEGFKEVLRVKKDWWPMLLFQFGNFMFPNGSGKEFLATCQSLSRLDGKTIKIDWKTNF